MAKKKSKTQSYKKSQQRKQKKVLKEQGIVLEPRVKKTKTKPKTTTTITTKTTSKTSKKVPKKKVVNNDKVLYNVALTKPELIKKNKKKNNLDKTLKLEKIKLDKKDSSFNKLLNALENKIPKQEIKIEKVKKSKNNKKKTKKINNKVLVSILNILKLIGSKIKTFFLFIINAIIAFFKLLVTKIKQFITFISDKFKNKKKEPTKKKESKKEEKKSVEIELPKLKEEPKECKKVFIKILTGFINNRHILFNAVLILTFAFLLIGLFRVKVYSNGTITYVACLIGFLSLVAISHNKHISGNIFTILLCIGMGFTINRLQYNYDFINNLNYMKYEYKTYYVVSFDNSLNKSIHNINNKKVGILKDNEINVERKLNTKLDKVNYIEYDNLTDMYNDFYNQKFRAVVVTENQYKYLLNNEATGAKAVKILYEFEANAQK